MEITKKVILDNLVDAIEYLHHTITEEDMKILNKVIKTKYNILSTWKVHNYLQLAELVAETGLVQALASENLVTAEEIGLPSEVEIPFKDIFDMNDAEDAISEWLSDKYGFCTYGAKYEPNVEKKVFLVTEIEWDLN
jgi:hypothetical protein